MAVRGSVKRLQIDKANTTIVIAVGVAAFALTFSLVAAKSLFAKQSYQSKVVEAREQALQQLDANIAAVDELKIKYTEFVNRQENIIKGSSAGNGERDGDNARIILDALPSKYDFPALASSLEKILVDRNYSIKSINGTDEEATQNSSDGSAPEQQSAPTQADPNSADLSQLDPSLVAQLTGQQGQANTSTAVEMPFEVAAEGSYKDMMDLLGVFKNSIRPMHILSVSFSATEGTNVELTIKGKSYFQPERTLNIREEVVQ